MSETMRIHKPMIEIALAYATHGWPVIPMHTPTATGCTCSRETCNIPGKHPRTEHGLSQASTDQQNISDWWSKWEVANIGIVTGPRSGLVVLDLDDRNGGDESLAALEQEYGHLPQTLTVRTGSGGKHFYFLYPQGLEIGNKIGFLKGLDIRARGGFVVAPPSLHKSGNRYQWINPGEVVAPFPLWLIEHFNQKRSKESRREEPRIFTTAPGGSGDRWLIDAIAKASVGRRNDVGFWLACQLRDDLFSQADAEVIMLQYANAVPSVEGDPYTQADALRSLRQAYRRPPREKARR